METKLIKAEVCLGCDELFKTIYFGILPSTQENNVCLWLNLFHPAS